MLDQFHFRAGFQAIVDSAAASAQMPEIVPITLDQAPPQALDHAGAPFPSIHIKP